MPVQKKRFETINDYIKAFPKDVQARLQQIRRTIRQAAPEAEETISYQMPAFKLHGRNLVYFAAWKNHIGLYPMPSGITAFKNELSRFEQAKGSVRFPMDRPLPTALVTKIVKFRAKENARKKGYG